MTEKDPRKSHTEIILEIFFPAREFPFLLEVVTERRMRFVGQVIIQDETVLPMSYHGSRNKESVNKAVHLKHVCEHQLWIAMVVALEIRSIFVEEGPKSKCFSNFYNQKCYVPTHFSDKRSGGKL